MKRFSHLLCEGERFVADGFLWVWMSTCFRAQDDLLQSHRRKKSWVYLSAWCRDEVASRSQGRQDWMRIQHGHTIATGLTQLVLSVIRLMYSSYTRKSRAGDRKILMSSADFTCNIASWENMLSNGLKHYINCTSCNSSFGYFDCLKNKAPNSRRDKKIPWTFETRLK